LRALPKITKPPQSPEFLEPNGSFEVKTIGLFCVPCDIILQPLVMTKVPFVDLSPLIIVPGEIVNVELLVT